MNAILVDDSEIDRLNLRTLLEEEHSQIRILGEAPDLATAAALLATHAPDLLFLDIHLGKEKGFQLLEPLDTHPHVILTTAHSQYALKGFDIEALDYILKPVTPEKLTRALSRLPDLKQADRPNQPFELDSPLFLKQDDDIHNVAIRDVLLITTDRPYTNVHVAGGNTFLHTRRIKDWNDLLPAPHFLLLDRSTLVNVNAIERLTLGSSSSGTLHFKDESLSPIKVGPTAIKILRRQS